MLLYVDQVAGSIFLLQSLQGTFQDGMNEFFDWDLETQTDDSQFSDVGEVGIEGQQDSILGDRIRKHVLIINSPPPYSLHLFYRDHIMA